MADSSSESLEIYWNSDDEREIGTPSAINQQAGMDDSSKEIWSIGWTTDHEQEIEIASPVHQDPFVDATVDDSGKEIDWTTEDELEIETAPIVHQGHPVDCGSSSSSAALPRSKAIDEFLNMGFPRKMVEKAFKAYGLNDKEAILDALLTYNLIENSPDDDSVVDVVSSDEEQDCIVYETKGASDWHMKKASIVSTLVEMGYAADSASNAVDRCGVHTPIIDLIEMMEAASMAPDFEISVGENFIGKDLAHEKKEMGCTSKQKRKQHKPEDWALKRHRVISEGRKLNKQPRIHDHDDQSLHLPSPMIGFGLPNHRPSITVRKIPVEAEGPPYFYYENVALTPLGVWQTISRFLYGIQPEFVDSKYLSTACRKRGYIHNLPINDRFQVFPTPPKTIHEALPHTKEHWPSWDPRTQLNCILSCTASAPLTDRIKARVDKPGGPSAADKKYVLEQCRKWNMIWVGKHKVAPLNPDEIELIMGFPLNHTRGGGIGHRDRLRKLASTF